MSLLVAGTIAIDNIKTPVADEKGLLGGSAAYAALSASFFHQPVHLVGIVGQDFPEAHLEMLQGKGVDLGGLERSSGESFFWAGEYFDNMNQRKTLEVSVNVLESWQPKIPPALQASSHVVLANMSPENQMQVLDQLTGEPFVVADTMDLWMEIAKDRLLDVLQRIDLLVLNDSEARLLAGTNNLIVAGARLQGMGPAKVIIKLGEHGCFLFGEGEHEFFSCAAYPLKGVEDPTGAGDTFLGGLIGHLAAQGSHQPSFTELKQACVHGTIMASFTCEEFSTRKLEEIALGQVQARLNRFREYTAF
ncbi:MAG: PfkB family carbohydrate kinase [Verrucomicrobiota bacterium]